MRHDNSVFQQLTKFIDWRMFEALVDKHCADHGVRRLKTKGQFLALLFGQLSGAVSLREIESGLKSHGNMLYHCGAQQAARSTLADANAKRPAAVFEMLFAHMVTAANRTTRHKMKEAIRLLDATRIALSGASGNWAQFCKGQCSAKLHIVYDPDTRLPLNATVSAGNINDITPAEALEIEDGATYVFDLAYYKFQWWHDLDARGCRFVTRLKAHTHLREPCVHSFNNGIDILSDRVGYLSERLARSRKNPYCKPLREITIRLETGKTIRIATNDLDAPARQIADLYKLRWQIELFFKWVKQNLKIKRFIGTSNNAVRTQIFVALIAYLLVTIAHKVQSAVARPIEFIRLLRINLMHKKPISHLNKPKTKPPISTNQLHLELQ